MSLLIFVALLAAGLAAMAVPASAADTTFTVTNSADSGSGSFRSAINGASSTPGTVHTIQVTASGTVNLSTVLTYSGSAQLIVNGNGLILDGMNTNRVLRSTGGPRPDATINNLVIQNGKTGSIGGGINWAGNLTLDRVVVKDNTSRGNGGGVYHSNGVLTIDNSSIRRNKATDPRDPVPPPMPGDPPGPQYNPNGGGVLSTGSNLIVRGSLFANNRADKDGGGVYGKRVTITNSTFVANQAGYGDEGVGGIGWGGGVHISAVGNRSSVRFSTFDSNQTEPWNLATGGAGANLYGGGNSTNLTFQGNVLANPVGSPNCAGMSPWSGTTMPSVTSGYNYSFQNGTMGVANGDKFCFQQPVGSTDTVATADPMLGALAGNGGPTQTLLPAIDSPLVDAIPGGAITCPDTDQRGTGYDRPWSNSPRCDIGAIEVRLPVVGTISPYTQKNKAIEIDVSSTFVDPSGYLVTSTFSVGKASHGSTSVVGGTTVRYKPANNYLGADSFDYTICTAGSLYCTTGTVNMTVSSSPPPPPPPPNAGESKFVPLAPKRVFDTRQGKPSGKLGKGSTIDVQIRGVAGVPNAATIAAVVLNVTATEATQEGYVTAFPSGTNRPTTSNLNLVRPGQTAPNLVTVPLGANGKVSFFSQNGTHLLADVAGYFTRAATAKDGRFVPLSPKRLFDTRTPTAPSGFVSTGNSITIDVDGKAGLPNKGVSAVALNLTADQASMTGFITAYPSNVNRPLASNLNLDGPGHTAANMAIVPVSPDGKITFYSHAGAHLIADVFGYFTDDTAPNSSAGLFTPLTPARIFDTRVAPAPNGFVNRLSSVSVGTTGAAGIPAAGVGAVFLNVTATEAVPGYITVYPSGQKRPDSSNLNLTKPNETRPNAAMLQIAPGGKLTYFTQNGAHMLADTFGFFSK